MLNFPFESRFTLAGAALAILVASSAAADIDLELERRSAESGKAKVCVVMDSKGTKIAGTQNDLSFDPTCATLSKSDCVASEHHGKPLHGSIPSNEPSTFRSLVFALDNVDPMADGDVYCCTFTITGEGDGCCAVAMKRLGASDPQGVAIEANAVPDRLCLLGEGGAEAQPAVEVTTETTEVASSPGWLWIAILAVAVLAVLFLVLRRAT